MAHLSPLHSDRAGQPSVRPSQIATLIQKIRQGLHHAAITQEKLAETREQLLKERERVRATGARVREKRVAAGGAEATFMSALREFLGHIDVDMPLSLTGAFHTVETFRDDLGVLEDDYREADRNLSGAEWTLVDQENDFFQFDLLEQFEEVVGNLGDHSDGDMNDRGLLPVCLDAPLPTVSLSPPLPSALQGFESLPGSISLFPLSQASATVSDTRSEAHSSKALESPQLTVHPTAPEGSLHINPRDDQYRVVTAELEELRKDFDLLRYAKADRLGPMDDETAIEEAGQIFGAIEVDPDTATPPYFGVLQQISDHEVAAQRLRTDIMLREVQSFTIERRCSDPSFFAKAAPAPSIFTRKALTESAVPFLRNDFNTEERVREWLLIYLKESAVQKALYRSILAEIGVPSPIEKTWEDRAAQFWDMEIENDRRTITRATSHDPEDDGTWDVLNDSLDEVIATKTESVYPPLPLSSTNTLESSRKLDFSEEHENVEQARTRVILDDCQHPDSDLDISLPLEPTSFYEPVIDTSASCQNCQETNEATRKDILTDLDIDGLPTVAPAVPLDRQTLQSAVHYTTTSCSVIPTIVTTDVDNRSCHDHTGVAGSDSTGQKHQSKTPSPQALNPLCLETSLSQILVLGITSRPQSDSGGEKSHRERIRDRFARLGKDRRSKSVSHISLLSENCNLEGLKRN